MSKSRNKEALRSSLLGGAAVFAGIYLIGFTGSSKSSTRSDQSATRETAPPSASERPSSSARPSMPADDPAEALEIPSAEPLQPAPAEGSELRRSLQHKLGRPSDTQAVEHQAAPAETLPSWSRLPEQYVAGVVREQLIPLVQACFEDIAAPGTAGSLTMSVVVLGDAEVGGAIERVDVDDVDASIEGDLTECIRQAAYELEFDPPEEGQGATEFQMSLRLSSEEPT